MVECSAVTVFFLASLVILQTSILVNFYFTAVFPRSRSSQGTPLSTETERLFTTYDTNDDGVVDVWEFKTVHEHIDAARTKKTEDVWSDSDIDKKFEELKNTSGEILKLKTEFTPLVLDSMTKFTDPQRSSDESMKALDSLRKWKHVLKSEAEFAVEQFKTFLPRRANVDLSEPWMIITPQVTKFSPELSSNRYTPPEPDNDHMVINFLLQMFHPRPFIYTRFPPRGSFACIRAENEEFLDIEFRVHAEYQLNQPPLLPFWFSPAQFSGHLVIAKDGSHIHNFEMEVPHNKSLNVDMEWLTGRKTEQELSSDAIANGENPPEDNLMNMEVDIGYLPKMKVHSTSESYLLGKDSPQNETATITWNREISREEAQSALEKKMYPFKEVPYLSFEKAYEKATEENKLVHSIVLWGALDDQSC